jgi:serine/threonine-protein kinase
MDLPERVREALADRYTIEREIGRGGMAVVYLARDLRHDRPVALKLLKTDRAHAQGPERFQREIYVTARLQHPHILTVLDSGTVGPGDSGTGGGQLWYTMPLVEGESLHQRLTREGRLGVDDALRITREVALALDYAHGQGVIHRDIKPENVMLTRDGVTLVADFGLAQALGTADRLTQSGTVMGTPLYMSPEQMKDEAVDARSDLYALAAVLYEMLSGETPFTGPNLHAIAARRLANPTPSVRVLRPDAPARVDAAIQKAMATKAGDRFGTVAEFAEAIGVGGSDGSGGKAAREGWGARRVSKRALTLAVGILLAGGAVFAWSGSRAGGHPPHAVPVVAVLPFDNLGDSADAYFADGVADEVRTKLAQLPGLELIARGSSIAYRGTNRPPAEIARELGADYLLTGTVRWEKGAAGKRVRVTPELVDARGDKAAKSRWVEPFDAALTDVFQVQGDIATRVASALGVALADSARRILAARPTGSFTAYEAFLKGEAASGGMKGDQASLRRAIAFYERAVALDSTFALAWSQLSRARTSLYSLGVPLPALGDDARRAAERALRLKPNEPSVYLAFGDYYGSVNPIDNAKAVASYEQGLALSPDNVDLLSAAALAQTSLGRWDGVATRLGRAALLDPRSATTARRLSTVQIFLRNYAAADAAADQAVALDPNNPGILFIKVLVEVARGDLDGARAEIRGAAGRIDPGLLYPFFASYQDLYWVLDDSAQRLVLAAPPAAFDDDRGSWGLVRTELSHLRGDSLRTASYADSARLAFEAQSRAAPDDAQRHALLGLSLAYLGRKEEAVREGTRGVELLPISRDGYFGPYVQLQLVRIHLLLGEPEKALDQLEPLLKVPFYLSPGWLRIDPTFDPVRENPRFKRLLGGERGNGGTVNGKGSEKSGTEKGRPFPRSPFYRSTVHRSPVHRLTRLYGDGAVSPWWRRKGLDAVFTALLYLVASSGILGYTVTSDGPRACTDIRRRMMHNFTIFDLGGVAAVGWVLVRVLGPFASALAKRIEGRAPITTVTVPDVPQLREELEQLHERVDFLERAITSQQPPAALPKMRTPV